MKSNPQIAKPQVIETNPNALDCLLGLLNCLSKIETPCSRCPPPTPRCPRRKKVTTRIVMPESEIASSIGGPLSIDQIEIDTMTIPSLHMNDFSGNFTYASCKAKNVELEITLSISSTFSGSIDLPWPLCWSDYCYDVDGGVDLDVFTETYKLGDIDFQSGSFSMLSPTTNISPFSMTPDPIRETTIGEVITDDVKMKCTSVPLENPLGVRLSTCLPIQNLMRSNDVITEETNMEKMESRRISSPQVAMKNISALNITIPSVTTNPFVAHSKTPAQITTSERKMYGTGVTRHGDAKDAKIKVTLTLKMKEAIMRVKGGLEFKNLRGTVTTASAISSKLDMNLVMKGIKIKGLNLCGMKIPEIGVDL